MYNYVQGASRIDVYVHKDGMGGTSAQPQGAKTGEEEEEKKRGSFSKIAFGGKNTKALSTFTVKTIQSIAKSTNSYVRSFAGARNGDKSLQEQLDRQAEIREDTINSALTIGIMGVQWGLLGIGVGVLSKSTELLFKYGERNRDYDMKVFKEENNIQYMRARAGINLTTGRLR